MKTQGYSRMFGLCVLMCILCNTVAAQEDSIHVSNRQLNKYLDRVSDKANSFNSSAEKYTRKTLARLIKQEEKMRRKVMKADTALAKSLFNYAIDSLKKFQLLLKIKNDVAGKIPGGKYFAYLDSVKLSLQFLEKTNALSSSANALQQKLSNSTGVVNDIEANVENIRKLKEFISLRKESLGDKLKQYPQYSKYLRSISKEAYYLGEKVNELQNIISSPTGIENAVAGLLREIPEFKTFIRENSQLSGLFSMTGFSSMPSAGMPVVNGIPSRSALQQSIQANAPAMANNFNRLVSQQMGAAVQQARNRINALNGEQEMPDYKTNSQKVKSFKKRLEYGFDLQFSKSNYVIPSSSDISMLVGYKLNDKSSIGVSGVYRLGMGTGWNNIRFSHMGVGFRSYINWKLKGSFYMQGGSEWNYNSAFKNIEELKGSSLWQQSALVGIAKKYKVSKKLKGNVQVMYDFLHTQHVPVTQPVIFRFGCNF
jgi:hypothetical protein